MLSVIIPVYREPYLSKTVDSILNSAVGDIEVIPVFDGEPVDGGISSDKRVKPVVLESNVGMRGAINAGLAKASGKYVMKIDAHCAIAKGFDEVLKRDCRQDWLMIPRRFSLDEDAWNRKRPIVDYHYLLFPEVADISYGYSMQVQAWGKRLDTFVIDDVMTFQGSCWFAHLDYFMKRVGFMDDRPETYGPLAQDQQEIGLKYWLGGGEVKVNKLTWYAHLCKRNYHYSNGFSRRHKKNEARIKGNEWGTRHWMNDEEPGMIHSFSWFVKKFWPIPTWPSNWQEVWKNHGEEYESVY